jgi:hypothetical protein
LRKSWEGFGLCRHNPWPKDYEVVVLDRLGIDGGSDTSPQEEENAPDFAVAKPISPSLLGFIRLANPEGATREQLRKSLGSLTLHFAMRTLP